MEAREATRTLEPLNENGDMNKNARDRPVARECTFRDFLKCKPQNFSGTEGVVGLTRWFKKMETAAYAMIWVEPVVSDVLKCYCHRNEIKKVEIGFVDYVLVRVERFNGGFPDNISRDVIAVSRLRTPGISGGWFGHLTREEIVGFIAPTLSGAAPVRNQQWEWNKGKGRCCIQVLLKQKVYMALGSGFMLERRSIDYEFPPTQGKKQAAMSVETLGYDYWGKPFLKKILSAQSEAWKKEVLINEDLRGLIKKFRTLRGVDGSLCFINRVDSVVLVFLRDLICNE
ncbi:hypothetical protein Tco_0327696 [Tanacetum coccineum]